MTIYGNPSPERIAETNALIAALESAPDYAAYLPAYSAVEQRANSEDLMGRWEERDRIWAAVNAIRAVQSPRIRAEYRAIKTYSLDELCAMTAPVNLLDAVTQAKALAPVHAATNDFCAMLTSRYADTLRPASGEETITLTAAE